MVPSPEALRSAARARLKAGDEALAATHAEALQRRYNTDEKSREVAEEILADLRSKLARITLTCARPCGVVVDGGAIGVEESRSHVFYVEQGRHTIGADFGDNLNEQEIIEAQAGKSASLSIAPPENVAAATEVRADLTSSPGTAAPRRGLGIGWFIASATVTAGLAGASIWSGMDVLSRNEEYERDPSAARLDDGQSRELRTNILIGATAAAAVATGVIAWKTRWSTPKRETSTLGLAPASGGAVVVLGGHFQ